jgi:hypothetical protein
MPKYMLLLHDDPSAFATMSPADIQQVLEKYVNWGDRLKASGILTDGQKLTDEPGKVVRGAGGKMRVTDGPYSETKEVLGGYYVVEADSYEQAVDRTKECPHLEYGGTIELRQIDNMGQ